MAPAKMCQQVDGLSGVRYTAKDGRYLMSDGDAKALKDAGGFYPNAMGAPAKMKDDRTCKVCGFASFFRECSRCNRAGSAES
jgi:CRISPR/Cas system-associated protein Cas10 (large subunit of type III CRISPR-Cas system)